MHSWWIRNMTIKLQMMRNEDILSFVFVRHPFDRLESSYYNKIAAKAGRMSLPYWKKLVRRIHKKCKYVQVWKVNVRYLDFRYFSLLKDVKGMQKKDVLLDRLWCSKEGSAGFLC